MKYIYTAIIEKVSDTRYECSVPDLPGCISSGSNLPEAIDMILDAASGWLVVNEDKGNTIPTPTEQELIKCPSNAIRTLLQIDTIAYRSATDTRCVRKNVSLPAWMANIADKRKMNCSQILQDGITRLLNVG
ncbi:MAG: type II toxin-antitoxin system HicB family antitoxin [Lachnospiraceae bacterium]|nr:type II toxin-antitoxin system HicB family antitoxin [Lachnospiraceae bacterium]MBO6298951.1 type II toxin-antitoxin system HicB family antitoxin [Lachnospiraceae bacterium]MBP3297665.1 type II toxin-antitoxin system HicB family antitoxin [Lachnospiraceae bacterium]